MNGQPFFSIVIPTYNRIEKLLITLSSVSTQLFKNFEIIVVNDGSTDQTILSLEKYRLKEPRLVVISQENKERGAARNNGFRTARGKYVVFFDSDDIMHPDHLEVLYQIISQQEFPFFVATKFDFINESGEHFNSDINKLRPGFYDYRLFLNGNILACNICVSKATTNLYLFEEDRKLSIKEDWLFLLQNLQIHKLFIADKCTVSMLDHAERSMRSDNQKIISKTLLADEWIRHTLHLNNREQQILSAHVNYFCSIHSYLDADKKNGIRFILKAIQSSGMKAKYITMFFKLLVGKKLISRFK